MACCLQCEQSTPENGYMTKIDTGSKLKMARLEFGLMVISQSILHIFAQNLAQRLNLMIRIQIQLQISLQRKSNMAAAAILKFG